MLSPLCIAMGMLNVFFCLVNLVYEHYTNALNKYYTNKNSSKMKTAHSLWKGIYVDYD